MPSPVRWDRERVIKRLLQCTRDGLNITQTSERIGCCRHVVVVAAKEAEKRGLMELIPNNGRTKAWRLTSKGESASWV